MKHTGIIDVMVRVSAVLPLMVAGSVAFGVPPRVIKAIPDNGDTDVDPALREIRVTFDQDMRRDRYSWVGGGPTFPKVRGRPRWIGSRTCAWSVILEPNHKYWLSINSKRHTNFQNLNGEPAIPYPISFTTGPGKPGLPKERTLEDNKAAVVELRRAMDEHYSYRDLRKVDWDALFRKHAPRMERSKSAATFAAEAAKLLGNAKDVHICLRVGEQTIGTFRRRVVPNYHIRTLARLVPGWRRESTCVNVGRFEDGIGYIRIGSWAWEKRDALEGAFEALDDFAEAKGLIIDVRPNSGGAEPLARHFAGCFVDKPVVYAKHVYRDANGPDGFTKPRDRVLKRKKGRPKYRGRVAVLMGKENMSSCEAFLLMMKQVPNCRLIGETSYGSSGNPKPVDLGNGVTVFLPSWKAMRPDGSCFEGEGIAPDIAVKTTRKELVNRDPVLKAALDFLRKP